VKKNVKLGLLHRSRSFKVIEVGTNGKHVCDFLSRVAQSCYSVIGDKPFLWSKPKFDHP